MGTAVVGVAAALMAVLVGLAARRLLGSLTIVDSESMVPTLTPGQRLLTRRPSTCRPVRRGDIVVVRSAELGRAIVKRVIGLPQEHVSVTAGQVRVNGRPLPEPYVTSWGGPSGSFDVPDGHLLLLGDNRAGSSDSRSWRQPYLPLTALRGFVLPSRGHSPRRSSIEDLNPPPRRPDPDTLVVATSRSCRLPGSGPAHPSCWHRPRGRGSDHRRRPDRRRPDEL
jgi:signal peptidase I